MKKVKEESYIKQLVSKFQRAEKAEAERNSKIAKWVKDKQKEDFKVHDKYLKKRSNLRENKERKVEEEEQRSQEKIEKALKTKNTKLSAITNTLDCKR